LIRPALHFPIQLLPQAARIAPKFDYYFYHVAILVLGELAGLSAEFFDVVVF